MIAAREGERGEQPLRPQRLERCRREAEVVEPPLHLRPRQGLMAEMAHGRAQRLRREQAAQIKPMAASPAGTMSCSPQVPCGPTILSRGTPIWAASFRAVAVM